MSIPPFVSTDKIAALCEWTTADRRQITRALNLRDIEGAPIDHHDESAFWNAIVETYFSNSAKYRILLDALERISRKAFGRRLEQKAFEQLAEKTGTRSSISSNNLNKLVKRAIESEAFEELALFLWADWLSDPSAELPVAMIAANEELKALFGDWRPAAEEADNTTRTEESGHCGQTDSSPDTIQGLFLLARQAIDEAERLGSEEPLATVGHAIEKLAPLLRSCRAQAQELKLIQQQLKSVIGRLRVRMAQMEELPAAAFESPLDCLTASIDSASLSDLKSVLEEFLDLEKAADEAKGSWQNIDIEYHANPFNKTLRQAWTDALDRYEQAEKALQQFVVEIGEEKSDSVSNTDSNIPTSVAEQTEPADQEPEAHTDEFDPYITPPEEIQEPILEQPETNRSSVAEQAPPEPFSSERNDEALDIASRLLERNEIGLFEIACRAGANLNYHLPQPAIAQLLGLMGSQDAESKFRFDQALQLIATVYNANIHSEGERFLLFAALSLPAITDQTLLARNLLSQIKFDQSVNNEIRALQATIVSLDRAYPALDLFIQSKALRGEQLFNSAQVALSEYARSVTLGKLAYQAATAVSHKLARSFETIASTRNVKPKAIKKLVDEIIDPAETDIQLINRMDRDNRGHLAIRRPIEARALIRLRENIAEFKALSAELIRAAEMLAEQQTSSAHALEATKRLGQDLHRQFRAAAQAFEKWSTSQWHGDRFSRACALSAAAILKLASEAFNTGEMSNPFLSALDYDQYRLSGLARRPEANPELAWGELRKIVECPATNWLEAFDAAMARRDHIATNALLPWAASLTTVRSLEGERREAISLARTYVENERAKLRDDLLTVMNYAPSGETSLDHLYQGIAQIDVTELPRIDAAYPSKTTGRPIVDFPDALDEIATAQESLRLARSTALKALESRIAKIEEKAPSDTVAALRRLVDGDELITLAEELTLVERGQDIKVMNEGPIAIEEFAEFIKSYISENPSLEDWKRINEIPSGSRGSIIFRKWLELRAAQGDRVKAALRDVLGEFGFVVDKDEATSLGRSSGSSRIYKFSVRVRPISDREFCSIARFGSEAAGQYKIVIAGKDARPNEIVTSVSDGDAGATIVFVHKWLSPDERSSISADARRLARTFCLVDEALVAFLSGRQRVLHDLFSCGIPFAAAVPYVMTPGSIPVESFFGRTAEIDELRRRDGSCIVYGGRQLGKSVLLDHIEKRGAGDEKSITLRLDCQNLTEQKDILALIDRRVRPATRNKTDPILLAMENWLSEDPERTILLMLDETNSFVRADAIRDFRLLVDFRGLMERTNRRFKVVLSGQNNVLRLTKQPNTPLAHFGQPICIGPLKGADYKSARDIVTEPLAAVGYLFDSPQLVSRILVETQFYPKLIQMFCRDLLTHIRGIPSAHSALPPWRITSEHIEATLRNQKLRKEIFETFRITLDLDKRYELVALIMAVDRSDGRKKGEITNSMTEQEIRDAAFYWWREGFLETSAREDLKGVLEELEGLGILTFDRIAGTYQLSSPIIANLIGVEPDLYDRLIAFGNEPPPHEVDPSKRRAPLVSPAGIRHNGLWLKPLTPAQISKATRAVEAGYSSPRPTLIFGSPDMLLHQVKASLQPEKYDEHAGLQIAEIETAESASSLYRQIERTRGRRCFVVPSTVQWSMAWIDGAQSAAGENPVVFVGSLDHAWKIIVEDPSGVRLLKNVRVETLAPLSAIEIEDQLSRHKYVLSAEDRAQLLTDTGGFLEPIGRWTDEHFSPKKEATARSTSPRLSAIPDSARAFLSNLVTCINPDDDFDVSDISVVCDGHDPIRVFNWLMTSGLAEPEFRERESLRLNRVFWSPAVKRILELRT